MKRKQPSTRLIKTVLTLSLSLAMLITLSCKKDKKDTPVEPVIPATDPVVYHGITYKTVKIGNQTWMVENLRTTKYRDGTDISDGNIPADWQMAGSANTGAWCKYPGTDDIYGLLYNWHAVNNHVTADNDPNKSLAPEGWHIPTDTDWETLRNHLGGDAGKAGDKMKEKETVHWPNPNTGDNSSGFTGLPGGYRTYTGPVFTQLGSSGLWWSSSNQTAWVLRFDDGGLLNAPVNMADGCSVRCIKDN